jgi:hypothetical protein
VSGWREWQIAEVVEAPDFQSFLQDQVVQVYDDSSDRTATLGTAVSAGMVSFLTASTALEFYNGTAWVPVSNPGDITSVTAGTGLTGGGETGDVTLDVNIAAVGSAILDNPNITGTATIAAGTVTGNLTVSGTATLSANTSIGNVSSTEIAFLDNVTSNIQTQLNGKVSQTNGFVTTAATGSAVVRNVSFATATPGTANGMDGDVWLVYTP